MDVWKSKHERLLIQYIIPLKCQLNYYDIYLEEINDDYTIAQTIWPYNLKQAIIVNELAISHNVHGRKEEAVLAI